MDQLENSARSLAARLQPAGQIIGDDLEDTRLLDEMATEAHGYLASFAWCSSIVGCWLARGVGGIFGLFLFQIVPANPDVDEWLWVMVGDIPWIYLSFSNHRSCEWSSAADQFAGEHSWGHL